MKRIITFILCLFVMASVASYAGQKAEKKTAKIAKELQLNKTEKAKVLAIFKKTANAKDKVKADKKLTADAKKEKVKELKKNQKDELRTVLGEERFKKYEALKEKDDDKHDANKENSKKGKK